MAEIKEKTEKAEKIPNIYFSINAELLLQNYVKERRLNDGSVAPGEGARGLLFRNHFYITTDSKEIKFIEDVDEFKEGLDANQERVPGECYGTGRIKIVSLKWMNDYLTNQNKVRATAFATPEDEKSEDAFIGM
jgi:hypothetical protein